MKFNQASTAIRLFFFILGMVIWLGIWLTGFSTVHWLLYIPAIAMIFAAITGICPGLMISKKLLGES
jgi:hypothetical protein